jgi:hypothetical protein
VPHPRLLETGPEPPLRHRRSEDSAAGIEEVEAAVDV